MNKIVGFPNKKSALIPETVPWFHVNLGELGNSEGLFDALLAR